ncbi:antibiotic biosynthesis monooxygenase [Sediminimonas sp.]|uniref:antibiotic biosynthesis monooxygenase family protein n=1 Tax=Sediminimonas sp. TaxID=2823379 RepID=UPI0025E26E67|nr:antibiotic biosynthesis monooxygenase [Sediminimonas sp.]
MTEIAPLPEPPYFAVIFTSQRHAREGDGYDAMATTMVELAAAQAGFLGMESARGPDGLGITVSYWNSEAAITAWKDNARHRVAQRLGKAGWYDRYCLRIARVERQYEGPAGR